jgi:hypothetical protein
MTRFFFNILRVGEATINDGEGTDLPHVEAARQEAILSARELLAEGVLVGEAPDARQFEIKDEHGQTVAVVPFREAIGQR